MTLAIVVASLVLSGCVPQRSDVVEGTVVTVALSEPFVSLNDRTSYGNTPGNAAIVALTRSGFVGYDDQPALVRDESFGTVELITDDPLTVRYTIANGVQWSDGVPVDAADMLLSWAAGSGALNTPDVDPAMFTDPQTGLFTDAYPDDIVYFDDATRSPLRLVSQIPTVDGSSLTLTYDEVVADWRSVVDVGLPTHIVVGRALGIDDPAEAKRALIEAIGSNDRATLAAISRFWSTGFTLSGLPDDPGLLVSNGPYTITDLVIDESVTVTANPNYRGDRLPTFEQVTVRIIPDALDAVRELAAGRLDVLSVPSTPEIVDALTALDGVSVRHDDGPAFEHLDLRFTGSKNATFDDRLLRQAFLKSVPRQQIVDTVFAPLTPNVVLRDSLVFMPDSPGYAATVERNGMAERYGEVDIEGAQRLIAQSGVSAPRVCVLFASTSERRASIVALIRASAQQAGFVVDDCGSREWSGLLGVSGHHDATLFGWSATGLGVANTVETFRTGGLNNYSGYSNPAVDRLLDELERTVDEVRQNEILIEVDRLLTADAYGVPIAQLPIITAVSDRVIGVPPSPVSPGVLWNVWEWKPAARG